MLGSNPTDCVIFFAFVRDLLILSLSLGARLRSKVDARAFGNKAVGCRDAGILTNDIKNAIRL